MIDIKRLSAPTVSKGFHLAAADVGATRKLLVAPVAASYPMRDGIEVMNLLESAVMRVAGAQAKRRMSELGVTTAILRGK